MRCVRLTGYGRPYWRWTKNIKLPLILSAINRLFSLQKTLEFESPSTLFAMAICQSPLTPSTHFYRKDICMGRQAMLNSGIVLVIREPSSQITIYRSQSGVFKKETELSEEDALSWLKGYTRCIALMRQWPDDAFSGIYVPHTEGKDIGLRINEEFFAFINQYRPEIVAFQQRGLHG